MIIDDTLTPTDLFPALERFFTLSGEKIRNLHQAWNPADGAPVFTVNGRYTTRGWTEWTQGFQYGCQILQFDATDEKVFLTMGRENTRRHMAPHISHVGVHDHGFNNVSTYGNLRRLGREGRFHCPQQELDFYELALKVSGAVQAARWTRIADGTGFIHSFNGPHSLFSDTIRSCRSLCLAHYLGHSLRGENDCDISLLERAQQHITNTIRYNVYFGEGRDIYDIPGRVAHEGIFNTADGNYRCPSTQQGYSPFSTWTRGLAWVLLGCAEHLEFFGDQSDTAFLHLMQRAAIATADFFIAHTSTDGIPPWDTGAPGLAHMPDWRQHLSRPDNPHEPFDSSAAAIAAQGLLRLGRLLGSEGTQYTQAGLTVGRTLFQEPYLSADPAHQGLLLHSVYHRPNGWDYVPPGKQVPHGESSMWGDYHLMELAVYLRRLIHEQPHLTFWG